MSIGTPYEKRKQNDEVVVSPRKLPVSIQKLRCIFRAVWNFSR